MGKTFLRLGGMHPLNKALVDIQTPSCSPSEDPKRTRYLIAALAIKASGQWKLVSPAIFNSSYGSTSRCQAAGRKQGAHTVKQNVELRVNTKKTKELYGGQGQCNNRPRGKL